MSKLTIVASVLSVAIIVGAILITNPPINETQSTAVPSGSAVIDGDNQIVELLAKGGYSPALVQASAGKNTILRVKTINTFDCSSALSIPTLGINKMLPSTGTTDIQIGAQKAGTQIDGTCSMGMYRFSIKFI